MTKYTHMYELQLGIDLTEILSPENIPGIKAYLGVTNDNDLLEAVVKDRYSKILTAMNQLGFGVINANFTEIQDSNKKQEDNVNTEASETIKDDNVASNDNEKIDNKEPKRVFETVNEQIVSGIKSTLKNEDVKEVSTVTINAEFINYVEGSEALHKSSGLSNETEITFDELDEGILMIVSYVNKDDSLKHSEIKFKKNMTRQEEK